jgi:ribosomal protein L34
MLMEMKHIIRLETAHGRQLLRRNPWLQRRSDYMREPLGLVVEGRHILLRREIKMRMHGKRIVC